MNRSTRRRACADQQDGLLRRERLREILGPVVHLGEEEAANVFGDADDRIDLRRVRGGQERESSQAATNRVLAWPVSRGERLTDDHHGTAALDFIGSERAP